MSQIRKQEHVLRVGILGCGRMANYHVRAIKHANAHLVAVADVNLESARRLAQAAAIQNAYGSTEELLRSHELDVVHIVTPPAYHYECAKTAIEHGVSVLIEKPVVFTEQESSDLYDRADKKGVSVCPNFTWMFHPKMQEVLHLLESGRLGRVLHVDSHLRIDPGCLHSPEISEGVGLHWSYKLPGGVLHNYMTHALYVALYFTGRLKHLVARGRNFGSLPQALVDHLTIQLEGELCSASVLLSFQLKPATQDLRIHCEKGNVSINFDWQAAVVEFPELVPRIVYRGIAPYWGAAQLVREGTGSIWKFFRGNIAPLASLSLLTSRFYDSILHAAKPPISRQLAVDVVKAEESIIAQVDKLHLDTHDRPSRQKNVKHAERVLVTGGAGYVGVHVLKQLLDAGYYVRALLRPTSRVERIEPLGVEVVFGDVRCLEDVRRAAEGMTMVVHVAAAVSGSPKFMVETAVQGMRNIASVAAEQGMKRGVYISSMSVYDFLKLKDGDRITEDSPLEEKPELRGAYTVAKRKAEDVALSYLKEPDSPWTILRPAVIIGNRDPAIGVGKRIGRTLICLCNARNKMRLIHVEEVASTIVEVLRNDNTKGKVFILSHDRMSLRQYVESCIQAGRRDRLRVIYCPYFLTWLAGLARRAIGRGAAFNERELSFMYRNVRADSSFLARQIGSRPRNELLPNLTAESTHTNSELKNGSVTVNT